MNTNTGRKASQLNEITDRVFTVVDLVKINTNVKTPTIRTHIKRNVAAGRYVVTGTLKQSGKRGKPSITYKVISDTTKVGA